MVIWLKTGRGFSPRLVAILLSRPVREAFPGSCGDSSMFVVVFVLVFVLVVVKHGRWWLGRLGD